MKKITFLRMKGWYICFLLAFIPFLSNGQCVNSTPYIDFTSDNSGQIQLIGGCTYSTEFNTINGLIVGENYIFTAKNEGVDKYVSITDASNVSIAHGPSPLIVNAITASTVRLHVSNSSACDGGSICHETTVQFLADCPSPIALGVTNLTSATATANWTGVGPGTAWDLEYGPTGFTQGTGTLVTNLAVATYNFIGLTPATTYQFYVRSKCTTEDSLWSPPASFTTSCLTITSYSENFDAYPSGWGSALPNCWAKGGSVGDVNLQSGSVSPASAPNYLYMWGYNGTTVSYASMPVVSNLAAGTHRLRFRAYEGNNPDRVLEVGYLTDAGNISSYVFIAEIPLGQGDTNSQEFIVVPGVLPATAVRLVFKNQGVPDGSTNAYIDDVNWETIPTCLEPADLFVSEITSASAVVAWSAPSPAPALGYEYYLSTSSTNPTAATPATGSVGAGITELNLSLLTPATQYYIWIRSVCSASDSGIWVGSATFKTLCVAVTEYTENFDSYPATWNGPIPDCWNKGGTSSVYLAGWSELPLSAPNMLIMTADAFPAVPTESYASMPIVSNLQANTHRLRFKAYTSSGPDRFVEIGYLTDADDVSTYMYLGIADLPNGIANAQQFIIVPGALPANAVRLVFKNTSIPGAYTEIYIDDVMWEAIPTVVPACATNVVATPNATCGNFATSITWDAVAGADGYKLKLGTTPGGTEVFNNENIGFINSYSFVGNFNTTYYYTIIPYNGFGDATGCTELSFATAVNGCYCTSLPISNDGLGITNVLLGATDFPTTDVTYFDHTATTLTLPQAINTNLQISFATGYTYNTYVWIDFNDNLTFETSEIVFTGESTNANPTVLNASFVMPVAATVGTHRMRIVTADSLPNADPCYSSYYGVTLDFSVNIIPAPTCIPPVSLTATNITSSSASLGWTESGTATVWDIEWGTVGFTPTGTPNIVGTTTNPHNLSGLVSNTAYSFYVRANCGGADGLSNWSGPFSFFTACEAANVPYVMDFETAVVPALPNCTSIQNVGTGNLWAVANNPGYGFTTKTLQYLYNSSNAANVWFFTQALNLTAGTTYTIAFDYGSNSTSYVEKLKVAYGTSANAASMTNLVVDLPSISNNTPLNSSTEFTATTTGVYYFGFNVYSIANQYNLYVDNINVQSSLSTGTFDTANFKYYPNPVTDILTVSYSNAISEVIVYNLLGQKVLTAKPNATQTQMDLSGLTAGTYLVKVTSDEVTKTVKVIKN